MNGIIKNEFNLYSSALSFDDTFQLINESVNMYNTFRPHGSCDYLTPEQAHDDAAILKKRWKKYKKASYRKTILLEEGPGGSSPQSNPPGPFSNDNHQDREITDLSS